MDLQAKIASLPPEKREALYQKLRKANPIAEKRVSIEQRTTGDGRNFVLIPELAGVVDSLAYHAAPRLAPKAGEIEIQVEASALNFRDLMIVLGLYPEIRNIKSSLGADCAGRVVRVGPDITHVQPGDEVYGLVASNFGPYATVYVDQVVPKPRNLSFTQSAAIPTVYLTAYHGLHSLARLSAGERVLIHSASGGVGLAAMEIAKWKGAEIYATAGSEEKRAWLRSLGVQHVFDSRSLRFADDILAVTNGEGVDVVLNSLPGKAIPKGMSILRPLGRFLEIGKRDIYSDMQIGLMPFSRGISFHAIDLGYLPVLRRPYVNALLRELAEHFETGRFAPLPMKTFAATEAVAAFQYMSAGQHTGKLVVDMHLQTVPVKVTESAS